MRIEKQKDGSTKVEYEDGNYYFLQKDKDPIDGLIDLGLIQKKTADLLENPYLCDIYLIPETFFYALSRKYELEEENNLKDKKWYKSVINDYNHEIKKQQQIRLNNNSVRDDLRKFNSGKSGKYIICYEGSLPQFVCLISKKGCIDDNWEETPEKNQERIVAFTLTRFIYSLVDIRKIESRISELKGLCAYLKMIAPDEFIAYCVLADKFEFNRELDTEWYYEIINEIIKNKNIEIL